MIQTYFVFFKNWRQHSTLKLFNKHSQQACFTTVHSKKKTVSTIRLRKKVKYSACFSVSQRKNRCFFLHKMDNEIGYSILYCQLFCNVKIRKPFELKCLIHHMSESYFCNISCVLYSTTLKFQVCVEACIFLICQSLPEKFK